jgi:hypothetical protein
MKKKYKIKDVIVYCFSKKRAIVFSEREDRMFTEAKEKRKEAEEKIDNVFAGLNGCHDRWFLQPMQTIDDCVPKDDEVL